MGPTLAERKKVELTTKLDNLEADFRHWEELSEHSPLEKHYTQVRSVLLPLRALSKRIGDDLAPKVGQDLLAESRKATQLILGVHRIWEFFRPKFAQRLDAKYAAFLEIADEFAWLCYQPVWAQTPHKRPPLVFLNSGDSPFVLRRESPFAAAPAAGKAETIEDEDFKKVLEKLPFPVIGVPWHEIEYLPEIVVIGHEVGHAVERDLNLGASLDKAIDVCLVEQDRAVYWKNWRAELCADAYGCLATGPAFAAGLADFLAGSKATLEAPVPVLRGYPPTLLRIEFNREVLAQMGCPGSVPGWDETYSFPASLAEFRPEAAAIAKAFIGVGGPLSGLIRFTGSNWSTASELAGRIVRGKRWEGAAIQDLRVIIAAMRRTFELDPAGFSRGGGVPDQSPMHALLGHMKPIIQPGKRSGLKRAERTFDAADKELGSEWYATLAEGAASMEV